MIGLDRRKGWRLTDTDRTRNRIVPIRREQSVIMMKSTVESLSNNLENNSIDGVGIKNRLWRKKDVSSFYVCFTKLCAEKSRPAHKFQKICYSDWFGVTPPKSENSKGARIVLTKWKIFQLVSKTVAVCVTSELISKQIRLEQNGDTREFSLRDCFASIGWHWYKYSETNISVEDGWRSSKKGLKYQILRRYKRLRDADLGKWIYEVNVPMHAYST